MIEKIISHIEHEIDFKKKNTIRLFHGRGRTFRGLEHINIDYFIPVIVIYLYQKETDDWLNRLGSKLRKIPAIADKLECIVIQKRYLTSHSLTVVYGSLPRQVYVEENELKYQIKLGSTQNIGFFPDMKNTRKWLIENGENKKVLNLFSYTCSLSVAAIKGKADTVVNVDMNSNFLTLGKKNHTINQVDPKKIKYLPHNIFKSWSKIKKLGYYDIIIIDPPFSQSGSFNFKRDYPKVISRIPQISAQTSQIIATLNHPLLDSSYLMDLFQHHCPQCLLIKKIPLPKEFPEKNPKQGLKVLLFNYQT
ncbi:MAG: methyltransferase [Deltaproteobacteria bacterium]|jgi:23S rRNA (cytosine1962-C5)-methyltransferase|nr:methyltransferase [Deltaproteobacteria bacterium]MBT4525376.1 methyltransferase [Deltaproteobacteria bacterium]